MLQMTKNTKMVREGDNVKGLFTFYLFFHSFLRLLLYLHHCKLSLDRRNENCVHMFIRSWVGNSKKFN